MTRKIILIVLTLAAFYYCLRFGYIWTAYGHGGQILGIPFALIMLFTSIKYFTSKTKHRQDRIFSFATIYFLTLAAFSITIEIIRNTKEEYFSFLYHEPGGFVNKIFFVWVMLGIIVFLFSLRRINKRQQSSAK